MKYEFIEKSLDQYELHYTDKNGKEVVKPFKRTIELATKLQSGDAEARFKMLDYLTSIGKTKEDLIIEKKVNGKIIRDETNYREFESSFLLKCQYDIAMNLYKELFGMDFNELLIDMGLTEENAQDFDSKLVPFSSELREILINGKVKTPSTKQQESK